MTKRAESAAQRWSQLDGVRQSFLDRCRTYSGYTLPKICLPIGHTQDNESLQHDVQSVGAQAVLSVANKLMLTLFAPTRPFIRLELGDKGTEEAAASGLDQDTIRAALAAGEKSIITNFEAKGLRPKFFEVIKHLVVTGNSLYLTDDEDTIRVISLPNYVVKRNVKGQWIELILREDVCFDELEADVQEALGSAARKMQPETVVQLYRWVRRVGNRLEESQWVNTTRLPEAFDGNYSEGSSPFHVLTWDLADRDDYGTGLVEDYSGDFASLSVLSEAQLNTAILISEFRWMVNPAGQTRPEDFKDVSNGGVVTGSEGDVALIHAASKSADLQAIGGISGEYINRIGRGFLMAQSMIRDAERVTREEIRLLANELESSLGGAYSRLSVELQKPLALWLLKSGSASAALEKAGILITVVSGLDALSRAGDIESLRGFLGDLASASQLPPMVLERLNPQSIISMFAAGWGIEQSKVMLSEEAVQQNRAQAAQAQVAQEIATAGGTAQAEAEAQPQE